MKKMILAVLMMTGLAVQAQEQVVNDPNAQVRQASGFTGISVSHAIDLYISQGSEEKVVVSAASTKDRDRIKTKVENGMLRIWYDNEGMNWSMGDKRLRAYVSYKTLEKLRASGASDIYVNGVVRSENLDIELSGASDFKGAVDVKRLSLDQSGSSDATISGAALNCRVHVSGASDVKGYDLRVDYCDAHASGSSDIRLTVVKEINAEASGSSDIMLRGDGVIRKMNTSGASSVKKG